MQAVKVNFRRKREVEEYLKVYKEYKEEKLAPCGVDELKLKCLWDAYVQVCVFFTLLRQKIFCASSALAELRMLMKVSLM